MPEISVIVPCYNQAEYLDECLQSVLDQTYPDWECIIINDGSPDNTEEVAKKWTYKDSRFKYIKKENGGLSSARNAGIKVAKGEWIQFLDCDDKITNEKFEESNLYFETKDLIITNYQRFNENGDLPDNRSFENETFNYENIILNWDYKYTIPIHCGIFRKIHVNTFIEELKAKEDWIFWIGFFKKSSSYQFINKKMALYRSHQESMTTNTEHMLHNELAAFDYIYHHIAPSLYPEFFKSRIRRRDNQYLNLLKYCNSVEKELKKIKQGRFYKFRSWIHKYLKI